ncbi:unnamed protein product [Lota lota]
MSSYPLVCEGLRNMVISLLRTGPMAVPGGPPREAQRISQRSDALEHRDCLGSSPSREPADVSLLPYLNDR